MKYWVMGSYTGSEVVRCVQSSMLGYMQLAVKKQMTTAILPYKMHALSLKWEDLRLQMMETIKRKLDQGASRHTDEYK
jgi:hypothetical protein